MKVWMNGTLCEEDEAVIRVSDHGFLYGMGLFETFRTYGGRPFRLADHAERMRSGCAELRIRYNPDPEDIAGAVMETMRANGLSDAYVRWSVSAGAAPLGLPQAGYDRPNVVLMVKPLPVRGAGPKELHLLRLPRSTPEGTIRRKSFHYMNNILGKWELAERTASPRAEGLFLDVHGHLAEGIVSNVFWVSQGTLFTPSEDTGCLAGVTRGIVMKLAEEAGIPVSEGRYPFSALAGAEEAFVTNSVQEIVPAGALYDEYGALRRRWEAAPGPITAELKKRYRQLTASEGER